MGRPRRADAGDERAGRRLRGQGDAIAIAVPDPGDPRLADYTDLTDVALRRRREPREGLFMAESLAVIGRAVAAGYRPRSALTAARFEPDVSSLFAASGCAAPVFVAPDEVLRATTGFRMHRGPMAAMQRLPLLAPADVVAGARLVLVLAGIVDHTNVGAAFRSGAALGADAVLVTEDCADPLYRRSVRVSMGAVFSVPWTRSAWNDPCLSAFATVALTPDPDALDLERFAAVVPDGLALIVGTEGPGLPAPVLAGADHRVRIPMRPGLDSLNVAAAVAVAVHALQRR